MSAIKKFLGQTAIYGVTTVISRLFNFILTPLFTGVFQPGVYAIFTKMYASASLINAILAFGMESTFFRYLNKHEDKKQEVYNNTFFCVALISTLFLISGIVFSSPIAAYFANGPEEMADYVKYVHYFVWLLFIDAICVIPFAKVRADERPMRFSLIKFLNIGSFIGFNLFFLFVIPAIIKFGGPVGQWFESWYRTGWVGYVFISNLIASVLTLILLLPELIKLQLKFDKELFSKMVSYSWPVLVANLSFVVNENLDKMIINQLGVSEYNLGIYGAVCKIAVFLSLFITAFRLGAEPFFFSHAKNVNAKQTYATILNYFVIALAVIFVGLIANIDILKHFIAREYWVGLNAVPFLLLGYVFLGIYVNLSIWYKLSDQTKFGLYISVVGAITTIVLNIVLVPKYGYMGSAWVSMLAYLVMMLISYVLGQKHYPIPYDLKRMLIYLFASVILVVLSFWVFNRNIYIGNALLLTFLAGVVYFEKDQLKLILKKR
ncbi:MAG: polysaccharide biosynthesis C-terminal domain-containing protein [Candidatus Pedobacter colombiensis]|uniref:Polysaccharide biosynthesis C-terminal domain-containing protein n=1 Tax=Candidatus Pedobacter colombiensis TaxID=3121371 RepID=A0AAJ6B7P8_9SPHI|nr:polysaccharide biosynthesis C-terminal domain-containing protein [Pedobacter sp.]WEK19726.1 MAG: polysaccharide biosynthesis C-terminal domain-containing protein [Pedobacter sp.]